MKYCYLITIVALIISDYTSGDETNANGTIGGSAAENQTVSNSGSNNNSTASGAAQNQNQTNSSPGDNSTSEWNKYGKRKHQ